MSVTRELRRRLRADQTQSRFEPCLPRVAQEPLSGADWIHEIKHDGFHILARRDETGLARTKMTIPFEFPCNARPVHRCGA